MNSRTKKSGFVLIDIMAGMFLLGALSTAMVVVLNVRQRAAIRFADQRQAIEIAREALADVQANHPPPSYPNAKISISPTTQPSGDLRWVAVTVHFNGRSATLLGVAPEDATRGKSMNANQPNPSRARRGFTITELLMALAIYGIAGLITARLFDTSMRVIKTNAQDPVFQLDQMSQSLRTDVWQARKIDLPNPRTIVLKGDNGKTIQWRITDHQVIRESPQGQAAASPSRRWSAPIAMTAQRQEGALVLRSGSDQWRFTAPMLAEESR